MKYKECPICKKAIFSDANIKEFCSLCGMGIPEGYIKEKIINSNGKKLNFCCSRCLRIYMAEINSEHR